MLNTIFVPLRKLAVVSIVLALLTLVFGENPGKGTLKGRVVDSVGAPVSRAFVLVHRHGMDSDGDRPVVDDNGSFSAELPPGFYDVFVSSQGFSPSCRQVAVEVGKTALYSLKLKMSELVNQPD